MRENRTYGSEGREPGTTGLPYPYSLIDPGTANAPSTPARRCGMLAPGWLFGCATGGRKLRKLLLSHRLAGCLSWQLGEAERRKPPGISRQESLGHTGRLAPCRYKLCSVGQRCN